ncbi:PREDICTED: gamma-interferon-inducible lysosomal thiol reductase-like [Ipomoea nil]|uniref:gamma-interferon-inducible lysosomal thiol reductase-like n=1 Tax=Ipomoea nil TaxID=35883 RepID=UPI000901F119|nr:PREDICTED: gamma-interferon-inducible lysosomal thiol reductase-like [Ipomoea nil]
MASPSQICRITFACFFISCFIIFQCHSSSSDFDDRVSVSLYYESLCPYCANFIVNQLVKLFVTDLGSIVNLRLIPWGNTQTAPNNAWVCQHGPDECLLDVVQACAINVWPNLEMHFRLVYCIERLQLENRHGEWNSCFAATGLSELPVRDCFNNGVGIRIEQGYGDETASLNPPHRFVPWVLVNNQPLQEDYDNFEAYICRAYRGNRIPQACQSLPVEANMMVKTSSNTPQVCFRE